jgi:hypothetical protein
LICIKRIVRMRRSAWILFRWILAAEYWTSSSIWVEFKRNRFAAISETALSRNRASHQRPLRADTVAKVENRTTPKISQKSFLRRLHRCKAPWRRYEAPWSFLSEIIWPLTSPRAKRISGLKNFRSSAEKDFFNNIRQKRPFHGRPTGQPLDASVNLIDVSDLVKNMLNGFASGSMPDSIMCCR